MPEERGEVEPGAAPDASGEEILRIHEAFRAGDLEAVRAAVDDPAVVPNGPLPPPLGSCLVYAIYHSPIGFVRTLLELGADPRAPVDDGFPPLIAALSGPRPDLDELLRLLLRHGADPNERGIHDYTPLHMAVAERHVRAVPILLDGGADPRLRTRIDDCETPGEMAAAAGLTELAAILAPRGRAQRRRLRSGLTLLMDAPGDGVPVRRQHSYTVRLRFWLNKGDAVRWPATDAPVRGARLEDDGATLVADVRIDRSSLVSGLFYGVEGMRVGGTRRLEMAPRLAYGDRGVPGVIPQKALLTAEITILAAR